MQRIDQSEQRRLILPLERIGDVFPDADLSWLERFISVPVRRVQRVIKSSVQPSR